MIARDIKSITLLEIISCVSGYKQNLIIAYALYRFTETRLKTQIRKELVNSHIVPPRTKINCLTYEQQREFIYMSG